jgi:phosphoribosylaminoimidazolecarboxamide formyltransferase/IMP cyclohydrolase
VSDFTSICVAIVKHGNLCGLSLGDSVADAFRKALATDPQTAFGSAVAANRVIDDEAAHEIASVFFEDLVAPDYTREALDTLRPKTDLRVFATHADQGTRGPNGSGPMPGEFDYKRLLGGFLVQTRDALPEQSFTPKVATQRHPVLAELTSLYFAWRAVKHVTSNGVVLAKGSASAQGSRVGRMRSTWRVARRATGRKDRSWPRTGFSRSPMRSNGPPTRASRRSSSRAARAAIPS